MVINLGEWYLITKTDPVTFTAEYIGWYAVHINANDVATIGAQPMRVQARLLFPQRPTEESERHASPQIDATCKEFLSRLSFLLDFTKSFHKPRVDQLHLA